ncbi:hypothetical protein L596_029468 [Steinernema carpocapsae]|uniref:Uncharacterized protein n=1 Tax=Steinernema carpocapsae TaxID=34508 RepID=A0A4V5ZXI5_STECR|nr:hypothetical protein L596_029468 [Steinernema carpocapsae]
MIAQRSYYTSSSYKSVNMVDLLLQTKSKNGFPEKISRSRFRTTEILTDAESSNHKTNSSYVNLNYSKSASGSWIRLMSLTTIRFWKCCSNGKPGHSSATGTFGLGCVVAFSSELDLRKRSGIFSLLGKSFLDSEV